MAAFVVAGPEAAPLQRSSQPFYPVLPSFSPSTGPPLWRPNKTPAVTRYDSALATSETTKPAEPNRFRGGRSFPAAPTSKPSRIVAEKHKNRVGSGAAGADSRVIVFYQILPE